MSEGFEGPGLGLNFQIDGGESFTTLARIDAAFDATTAKVVTGATKIEQATGSMVKLGSASAQITTMTNSLAGLTREEREFAKSQTSTIKTVDGLIRQLDRATATFGKTREEIRASRVEEALAEAQKLGLTVYGFFKSFGIDVAAVTVSLCSFTIEGLAA